MPSNECHPWEFTARDDPEQVVGWKQQIPSDGGPREFANGTPTNNENGTPVAYVVAPGDVGAIVAERFCVNLAYLSTLNSVRRSGVWNLHPGDTLNLDAHTILSVGDEAGAVLENMSPSPIPPQH
ncbi:MULTISPECIES: hypothetical protein [unclassified Salinibacterium]|uniref:hypothetical protein n=1 Tax=unclassified Salinibacterium TaxID=2632331 RepID=UPI00141E15AC|nr:MULTISPECIES: hypothetical protein [unclassified Salinibacterium]